MARTYTVYLNADKIPTLHALQAAIKALDFKLILDEGYVPLQNSAYLPCTLDGEDAGVILRFEASQEFAGKDTAMTLQWGGDPREQVSALMIAATLAHGFGAVARDQIQHDVKAETLLANARKQFSNLD